MAPYKSDDPHLYLKDKLLEGSPLDASDTASISLLLDALKDSNVRSVNLTQPTPEMISAIAELDLESIKLRYDDEGSTGGVFNDNGKCFVKLLERESLSSLDLEFSKDSKELEGVIEGLEKCHLRELKIGNPQAAAEDDKKSLGLALAGVRSLEKLEVRNWNDVQAVGCLLDGLGTAESGVTDFYFRSRIACHSQMADLLQKPECKLVKLGVLMSKPQSISSSEASHFSDAVENSKLKSLTLLLEGSDEGDSALLEELGRSCQLPDNPVSFLHLILLNSDMSNMNFGRLFKSNLDTLNLSCFATKLPPQFGRQLVKAVQDPEFMLKSLSIKGDEPLDLQQEAEEIVSLVERNFKCPLESLELGDGWKSTALGKLAEKIMEQNRMYRNQGLADEDQVEYPIAKLFILGDDGVGKTTLRKNLLKKYVAKSPMSFWRDGKKVQLGSLLNFGNKSLLVCDFQTRAEAEALHDYVAKGTDKDLFLVVCKDPQPGDYTEFEDRLRYWFNFILSHRTLTIHKPKLMVVLNHFSSDSQKVKKTLNQDAFHKCESILDDYSKEVDLGRANIFGLRANKPAHVQALKKQLEVNLSQLLESKRPRIPRPCWNILEGVKQERARLEQQRLLHRRQRKYFKPLLWFFSNKSKAPQTLSKVNPKLEVMALTELLHLCPQLEGKVGISLTYLHNQGEVIYFKQDNQDVKKPSIQQQFVVLDVWWLARTIVSMFLQHTSRPMPITEIKYRVAMHCEESYLEYIIFVLHHLGLLFLDDVSRPRTGRVLASWQESEPRWRSTQSSCIYWGRRFQCKDPRTLLPWKDFTMLQTRVTEFFSACEVGGGCIYLVENGIHVIIKFGRDRQWLDFLLRIPETSSLDSCDGLFQKLRNCLMEIYTGQALELEEKAIRPASVEDQSCDEADNIQKLFEEADRHLEVEGLLYVHTWKMHMDGTTIFELITPSERRQYMDDKLKKLEPIKYEVYECLPDEVAETPISDEILVHGTAFGEDSDFKQELIRKATEDIKATVQAVGSDIKDRIGAAEQNIIREIRDLRSVVEKEMQVLRKQGEHILAKLKLQVDFELPKYPYLTNNANLLRKYTSEALVGKSVRLHLLCEHGQCHPVKHQKGLTIHIRPDWFQKVAPVLVPALRLLFVAGQIVAKMYLGAKLPFEIPAISELENVTVQTMVKKVFGDDARAARGLYKKFPSGKELQLFYDTYIRSVIVDKSNDIEKHFGLHSKLGRDFKTTWICSEHLRDPLYNV